VRFAIVSCHLPEPEGNSPGRALLALGDGLVEAGHEVEAWSWRPEPPRSTLPAWCRWEPLPPEPRWRTRARALARPRSDVARAGWAPPPGAVALADEPTSVDAVLPAPTSAVTFHYRTALDLAALHQRPTPWHLQQLRLERRAARLPALVLGYSERVRASARAVRSRFVPMGYPIPPVPIVPVDEPVVALLAGWTWPPNRWALDRLLAAWPEVRAAVPRARLVLAGRGLAAVPGLARPALPAGVEVAGEVATSREVLARTAVVAFPCPPTSGPKGKIIEALAHGVPVLTTPAGVEGLAVLPGRDAAVVGVSSFAPALADLLRDPERRGALARAGRAAMEAHHSPLAVARARAEACGDAFPTLAR
jgi:glycosyltransferase involved in cell wall biosynthesis